MFNKIISDRAKNLYEKMVSDPSNIPVSFVYGGKEYTGLGGFGVLQRHDREEKGLVKTTLIGKIGTSLQVRAEISFCEKYGEIEYTVYFENKGTENSSVLEKIICVDAEFKGESPVLKGILGDHKNQYHPYEKDLTVEPVNFLSLSGRATHVWFPYFNLEHGNGGTLLALGWAGTWETDFVYNEGKTSLKAKSTVDLETVLLPGESVRTALVVMVPYNGRNEAEASNLWRRWFLDYNIPKASSSGDAIKPFTTSCFAGDTGLPNSDGSISERYFTWRPTLNKIIEENIPIDFRWFDAGWYCDPENRTVPENWWGTIGTWELDKEKWPDNSFAESVEACRKEHGMKTLVWFEPERVTHLEALCKNYGYKKEWAFGDEDDVLTSNIGDPECLAWTTERVLKMMRENGVDLYREDNNSDPEGAFRLGNEREEAKHGFARKGITENKLICGHYQLWDNILNYCADNGKCTFLDSCASGGGRNDIESMRRSLPFLRSDSDRTTTSLRLSMSSTFNKWIPFNGASMKESAHELEGSSDFDAYIARASYLPICNLSYAWSRAADKLNFADIRAKLAEWKSVSKYLLGDFYVLTPYHTEQDRKGWTVFVYCDREHTEGAILAFRMEECQEENCTVSLDFLKPDRTYEFTDADTKETFDVFGKQLTLSQDSPRSAMLLNFKLK